MRAIDLFAGLGGFTQAATSLGIKVLWAANHWQLAVDAHAVNHPSTIHSCQDLHQANWEAVPRHNLLLASPCCQGHAHARGKEKKQHDKSRSTAWAVVSCAEYHKPYAAVVENVPEFLQWSLFPAWRSAMETLGYSLSINTFDAADAGIPQNRVRLFIVCTRSKRPMVIKPPCEPHVGFRDMIDWYDWRWSRINKPGRAKDTLARIVRGRKTFGERFLIPYYGSGSGLTGRSLNRPLGTVTTLDRWAIVRGKYMRMLQVPEYKRAMSFPDNYIVPLKPRRLGIHLLGNAVPPLLAQHVIQEIQRAA